MSRHHHRTVGLSLALLYTTLICIAWAKQESTVRQFGGQNFGNGLGQGPVGPIGGAGFGPGGPGLGPGFSFATPGGAQGGCPLCDSSVYSYCSHKMIHDACCCDFQGAPQLRPPQCAYYDCSLLYAKSCYEHALIRNCCCNSPY